MVGESPHPYPEPSPPTTDKASPATCSAIKIGVPKHPSELYRPETHAEIERRTLIIQDAGVRNKGNSRDRECTQQGSRIFAKQ